MQDNRLDTIDVCTSGSKSRSMTIPNSGRREEEHTVSCALASCYCVLSFCLPTHQTDDGRGREWFVLLSKWLALSSMVFSSVCEKAHNYLTSLLQRASHALQRMGNSVFVAHAELCK